MKKLAIMILVVACSLTVAASSFAEDRVSISGRFDIMAWSNDGYTSRTNQTFNDDDEVDFIQQRWRTLLTIKVADDVKFVSRFDIGEATYGQDFAGTTIVRPQQGTNKQLDFDRIYLHVTKENWELIAGQYYAAVGLTEVMNAQTTGAMVRLKFDPVKVSLIYGKIDEGASISDEGLANEDQDLYAFNVEFAMDNAQVNLYGATKVDDQATEDEPIAIGVNAKAAMGAINLKADVTAWMGDTRKNGPKQDYDGFQAMVHADTAVNDALTVGGDLFYATARDGADLTIATLADFTQWDVFAMYGPEAGFHHPGSVGSGLIMDFTGDMAGVMGAAVYAKYAIMEGLRCGGQIGYLEPEDDDYTDVDSAISANAYIAYTIATNTELSLSYYWTDVDFDVASSDAATAMCLHLRLNF